MTFRSQIFLILCAITSPVIQQATAQTYELFTGYSVTRMKGETDSNRATMNGWNTSITGYPTSRFGLTADFAGFYGSAPATASVNGGTITTDGSGPLSIRQYSFMAGPQVRLLQKGRLKTSFKALFGGAYEYVPTNTYGTYSQTTFAANFGSNIDIKASKRVAIRFSPGLYLTQYGNSGTQKNFRFSVGPVFKFGEQ